MILSDFCDERGAVHTAAKLTGMSAHFTGDGVPPPEQWAEMRAQILVSRRYMVVDETLEHLHDFTFQHSFVLIPSMLFEVSVDPEAKDLVCFEFEGVALSPTECLERAYPVRSQLPPTTPRGRGGVCQRTKKGHPRASSAESSRPGGRS